MLFIAVKGGENRAMGAKVVRRDSKIGNRSRTALDILSKTESEEEEKK